jgi:streptogramin lyase
MQAPRRDWRVIAAGVVVALVVLAVAGRLQSRGVGTGGTGPSVATPATAGSAEGASAAMLSVTGRVALPGRPVAVAVGEGALWVLLQRNTLLRVDPDRHQVTGSVDLAPAGGGEFVGPLAVGEGAVWVGAPDGTVTLRVDPVRLRVTGQFGSSAVDDAGLLAAGGRLWSYCCQQGGKVLGLGRTDVRTLRADTPLVLVDESDRRKPVGRFAVAADAVWVEGARDQRLWRLPLASGRARAVRLPGFAHGIFGIAVGEGAVWVLSGAVAGGAWPNQTGWLLRLDPRSGSVTATTALPELFANLAVGPVVGGDAVWLVGQSSQLRQGGSVLLRVDPASGRVVGWFRSRLALKGLLAVGSRGAWVVTGASELLHVVPA